MVVDVSEFVAGGYFLSRHVRDVDRCGIALQRKVTLACDHSPREFFPNAWAIPWCKMAREHRVEAAAEFGIAEQDLDRVMAWADAGLGQVFGWWTGFFELGQARAAARTLLARATDLELWGVGLHRDLLAAYCEASAPPPPEPGYAPTGASAVHETTCVRTAPLAQGGAVLGFEILVEDCGGWNSPEAHHMDEAKVLRAAGVTPNALGLIDSYADALRCCQRFEVPADGGPAPLTGWLPWLLVQYPLETP